MVKKHILQHEYIHGFKAIGIFSAQKDYRMCWLLNNCLKIEMKRISDFRSALTDTAEPGVFSVYLYKKPRLFLEIIMMPNRSESYVLFPGYKNLDYLLLIKNPSDQIKLDDILNKIKKIPQIQAAFLLDNLPAKRASEFFFDFELFLSQQKSN